TADLCLWWVHGPQSFPRWPRLALRGIDQKQGRRPVPPAATPQRQLAEGSRLARIREQFLTAERVEPNQVRDTILASWWRSRRWRAASRPTWSGTSTTPRTSRTWPAPGCPFTPRSPARRWARST